jgi:hypothetical protein
MQVFSLDFKLVVQMLQARSPGQRLHGPVQRRSIDNQALFVTLQCFHSTGSA